MWRGTKLEGAIHAAELLFNFHLAFAGDFKGLYHGFRRMIADARQKPRPFDEVVVYNWSRFFRDATEALVYIRELERLNVRVRAVTQDVEECLAQAVAGGSQGESRERFQAAATEFSSDDSDQKGYLEGLV